MQNKYLRKNNILHNSEQLSFIAQMMMYKPLF